MKYRISIPRIVLNLLLITASTTLFCFLTFGQGLSPSTKVTAYPNPSDGVFTVQSEIPFDQLETVLITEINGRVIHGYTLETSPTSLLVDFHNHPPGEYYIHLVYKESSEHVRIQKN